MGNTEIRVQGTKDQKIDPASSTWDFKRWIPARARRYVKDLYYRAGDFFDFLLGRKDPFVPPRKLMLLVGPSTDIGCYKETGEEFFQHLIRLCSLKPNERILDVGCGSGRMARPLTQYLNKDGAYQGFDIVPEAIAWCNETLSARFPNFHFQVADLFNTAYNPGGKYKASEYRFPYEGQSFDVVMACSVFTHMVPAGMENYFSEISRVLKPGGRCLISYLLLNEESERLIREGKSSIDLTIGEGTYRLAHREKPESAIGFREDFIRQLYRKYGLDENWAVQYGIWCGRNPGLSYQDIVTASRS